MAIDQNPEQDALLSRIEEKHTESLMTDYELAELILQAHADGISWERIGAQLGITRQSAAEKYGAMERRRKSDEYNKSKGR